MHGETVKFLELLLIPKLTEKFKNLWSSPCFPKSDSRKCDKELYTLFSVTNIANSLTLTEQYDTADIL
jgi:hypothetical protein